MIHPRFCRSVRFGIRLQILARRPAVRRSRSNLVGQCPSQLAIEVWHDRLEIVNAKLWH